MPFFLRCATLADAPFLATCLMEAMGGKVMEHRAAGTLTAQEEQVLAVLTTISQRDDTLYSWRLGTIATTPAGAAVGASVAYPGAEYHARQQRSFALARDILSFDVAKMEDEAEEGEYYLDTLAVVPSYRRQGIGHLLLHHWLAAAQTAQLRATLIYSKTNLRAKQVYESIGMRDDREIFVFGEYYMKMTYLSAPCRPSLLPYP